MIIYLEVEEQFISLKNERIVTIIIIIIVASISISPKQELLTQNRFNEKCNFLAIDLFIIVPSMACLVGRNKVRFLNEVSAPMKAMESSGFAKLQTDIQSGYRRSRSYHSTNWVTGDGAYRENPISNSLFFSGRTGLPRFYTG